MIYRLLLRPILFRFDAESVHHFAFALLGTALRIPGIPALLAAFFAKKSPSTATTLWGLPFPNRVGLAAGFDKDGKIGTRWGYLGFGFVELGTVTPRPQAGNPRPRLFRLPQDRAIINRMGFNNGGVDALVAQIRRMPDTGVVLGANIGKNKDTPNDQAVQDYLMCFEKLFPYVDYFVVNVSSPNTPGLRELQERAPLTHLLNTLQEKNQTYPQPKPLLLKIAPDLTDEQLREVAEVLVETGMQGLIVHNTTVSRADLQTPASKVEAIGAGGLSGAPLTARGTEILQYMCSNLPPEFPIISVGGIMDAATARQRIASGAQLIQVYTGFVYGGPAFVKKLLKDLNA